jgi:predicted RNA methylase
MMRIKIPDTIVTITVPGGQVLFDRETKAAIRLDSQYVAMWQALRGAVSVEEAAAALAKGAGGLSVVKQTDLSEFVWRLVKEKVIGLRGGHATRAKLFVARHGGLGKTAIKLWRGWRNGAFDRKHGTDTTETVDCGNLRPIGPNQKHSFYYVPTPVGVFRTVMRVAVPAPEGYTFIDFGSGKGRVLLMASDFAFDRVIGVEFSPHLHEISERNIAVYRPTTRRCRDVTSILCDAADFELPNDDLVLYFWTPFGAAVLERVLDRIRMSCELHPRRLIIIVYAGREDFIEPFRRLGILTERAEISLRGVADAYSGVRLLVFVNNPNLFTCARVAPTA